MAAKGHFRAFPRRAVGLEARVRGDAWDREFKAPLADLGLGGACIEAPTVAPHGASVRLEIDTPTLWHPLLLSARVAWCAEPNGLGPVRVGLRFEHHRPSVLRALVDLMALQT
jgi:hypothetical protein